VRSRFSDREMAAKGVRQATAPAHRFGNDGDRRNWAPGVPTLIVSAGGVSLPGTLVDIDGPAIAGALNDVERLMALFSRCQLL
jgi:hypothetical protein